MSLSAGRISLLVSALLLVVTFVLLLVGGLTKFTPLTEVAGLFFMALGLFLG